ncbi:biofilm maintenance protein MbaA [Actinoplanes sp. SE50]|uniref:GGDEF domain-containing protein n=1 Tax=unclassified Actinoplanes TaxID=2626549 RepID=UPI00023EBBC3|nr:MULTISPECIES: GGDEF domain-containing protein [unclassified Actinoplanes]AEV85072.1 putative signaling protein [Actinoplanes sp. SE50/110]ATO83463.1 biofilm maintenance protein MbaA [Actinoplanes sp. SE50]SLM00870.1 Stalked cell differentiation-controlling protein [Actinoplanes sp. SE50/110]
MAYPLLPGDGLPRCYFDGIGVGGTVAVILGILRNRPRAAGSWWLLAAGQLGTVAGDIMYDYRQAVLHNASWPGPPEALYLTSDLAVAAGLFGLLRRRRRSSDHAAFVDSAIIASAFALLSWIFLIKPAARDASLGRWAQAMMVAFPTVDLLLLAMVACLLTVNGARNTAFFLIISRIAVTLVGDYTWLIADRTSYDPGEVASRLVDIGFLIAYVTLGAAALHPNMVEVGQPTTAPRRPTSAIRLVFLAAAVLIAPVLLAWQARTASGYVPDANAIASGSAGLFLLVVIRMALLLQQVRAQNHLVERQAQRLRELAERDVLTGLPNRRAWDEALPAALNRAARDGSPVTVAILDVDHFKAFNDTYGHPAGDRLLREAAASWRANLREADLIARYGGEEFVALLPGTPLGEATITVDRLRPTTPMGCTFSAGVATWDGHESAAELVSRADRALYRAKHAGRDRV